MIDLSDNKNRFFISGAISFLTFVVVLSIVGSFIGSEDSDIDKKQEIKSKMTFNTEADSVKKSKKIKTKISKSDSRNYIVKRGDSLYKISIEKGISVEKLKKINSLKSTNLAIGQVLLIN